LNEPIDSVYESEARRGPRENIGDQRVEDILHLFWIDGRIVPVVRRFLKMTQKTRRQSASLFTGQSKVDRCVLAEREPFRQ
jgi:hypothetical protein